MERKRASRLFLLVLGAILLYLCFLVTRPFLGPFFLAIMMAIVCRPLNSFLGAHIHRRSAAALLSTILVLVLLIAPAIGLVMIVNTEITRILHSLDPRSAGGLDHMIKHSLDTLRHWSGNTIEVANLPADLSRWIKTISHPVLSLGTNTLNNMFLFATNTMITFFSLFYLFREDRSMREHLVAFLPLNADQVERLMRGIDNSIIANVHGCVAVAAAQGLLTGVAFCVLGFPLPVLWGIVTGLFSMVPVVGSGAVWVPAAILMLLNGEWWKAVVLLVWGALVVAQVDNVVRPYVISKRSAMHPLAVFISLTGGMAVFGVLGLFVGPVIFSVTVVVFQMLKEGELTLSVS